MKEQLQKSTAKPESKKRLKKMEEIDNIETTIKTLNKEVKELNKYIE